MPVLFKVKEGGELQPDEYINISRIANWPLTLDLGKKGYLSTASEGRGFNHDHQDFFQVMEIHGWFDVDVQENILIAGTDSFHRTQRETSRKFTPHTRSNNQVTDHHIIAFAHVIQGKGAGFLGPAGQNAPRPAPLDQRIHAAVIVNDQHDLGEIGET